MSVTPEPTDADLVARMARADRDAFATLFRRHQATVYRFCRQMLGATDAAEDVTQEVFMALAENAHRFDASRGSLTTYLYGIARHLILKRHKRRPAGFEVDIAAIAGDDRAMVASDTDPVEALSRAQLVEHLRAAILTLPVHYREAIVLCELHGLSYEDAAAVSRCPIGTIRSRLSRARQLLMERCHEVRKPEGAERRAARMGRKTWLIPHKNHC